MKLCRDCRYYREGSCKHSQNMRVDFVNGGMASRNSADFLRAADALCGPEARWFEPIPVQEVTA